MSRQDFANPAGRTDGQHAPQHNTNEGPLGHIKMIALQFNDQGKWAHPFKSTKNFELDKIIYELPILTLCEIILMT